MVILLLAAAAAVLGGPILACVAVLVWRRARAQPPEFD